VLLPGFPNPVRLSIAVDIDPAGLPLSAARSSLHAVRTGSEGTVTSLAIEPGERVNRDFLLRLGYGTEAAATAFAVSGETFQLTVLPPVGAGNPKPRDVVLVLDRSGSMHGWKMVAARRAAARIVDTLTAADRFAVLTFDNHIDRPAGLPAGLTSATDRNRYRAVEHLARVDARGGTELLAPLREAAGLLTDAGRDRVLVLVTDGQVGNEDQILAELAAPLRDVRVHTVGIDQAVNAGFLGGLAGLGGGRCELVESEDRLDEATDRIHQRIGAPLLTGVKLAAEGVELAAGTLTPARFPAVFPGVPLVVRGRLTGSGSAAHLVVTGTTAAGDPWERRVAATAIAADTVAGDTLTAVWARAHLRDLEDEYAIGTGEAAGLEQRIVATSLRYGVLCRFTAFVAVDSRVVTDGTGPHRVTQPVELPAGWELPDQAPMPVAAAMPMAMRATSLMVGGLARGALDSVVGASAGAAALPPQVAPMSPPTFASPTFASPATRLARHARAREVGVSARTAVRTVVAAELARLRAGEAADEVRRRIALADLGSRLDALLRQLADAGDPADHAELADLRSLAVALASCDGPNPPRGADLTALYDRAVAVLSAFAHQPATPGPTTPRPGTPNPAARPVRTAFWKRT
jgi:Ca-activated chloride channel family protein